MNRAWTASFSDIWHSPNFPMWLTIVAAVLFAVILLVTLFRAEKSAANGALTVITLLAVGIAAAAMVRAEFGRDGHPVQAAALLPALSCLDELAGEAVETACEKAVFASADSTAAAVSHAARQITTLAGFGSAAAADEVMTPDLQALRRAIERDRFGLIAHVLTTRDGCTLSECGFFKSLTNTAQISINMSEKLYDGLVGRYAPSWGAPAASHVPATAALAPVTTPGIPPGAAPPAAAAAVGTTVPTGKPVSGDFPSAASIPPINIMTAEPPAAPKPAHENTASTPPRTAPPAHPAPAAAKKPPAQKSRPQAPVPLAPPPAADDN